jgi:hypothetical protein
MVESNGIIPRVVGKTKVKNAYARVQRIQDRGLLASENVGWWDPGGYLSFNRTRCRIIICLRASVSN